MFVVSVSSVASGSLAAQCEWSTREDSDDDWAPEIQGAANVEKSEEEALKVLLQPSFVKEEPERPACTYSTYVVIGFVFSGKVLADKEGRRRSWPDAARDAQARQSGTVREQFLRIHGGARHGTKVFPSIKRFLDLQRMDCRCEPSTSTSKRTRKQAHKAGKGKESWATNPSRQAGNEQTSRPASKQVCLPGCRK